MSNEIQYIIEYALIGLAVLLPIAFIGFFFIDKIFKRLHESFNSDWESYGKPCGLFYYPLGTRNMQSMLTMQMLMFTWFFKTPLWIKNDACSASYLLKARACVLIWNVGFLSLLAYMFVLYGGN